MTELQSLALYSGAILAGAVGGGLLPLLGTQRRSDVLLSFSAGVMLGAAFFHMLPEAIEEGGSGVTPVVLGGFLLLYLLERFVLIHVCAEPAVNAQLAQRCVEDEGDHHDHGHGTGTGCEVHTLGLAAWIGMSLHTMVDGFVLGAANSTPSIGLLVFVAIVAHKIPSAFSLSAILRAEGYGRGRALLMNVLFAAMVPVGAGVYLLLRGLVHAQTFTAYALAASAGTFLHLALSDILPDLHRRQGSKLRLSGALLVGLAAMWSLTLLSHAH
ncbi:MAG TPA: ZIP family metal transporter [Anaeromyxobacteraceae bacterium]|nr:ZIP family metal transporter [Anaeromyxobacteraceae bacterium]